MTGGRGLREPTSTLIERAQKACERFERRARKPIVVEFAGAPKAGKTSTISQVAAFFKRCGFRVEVVVERASICPIRDKKHANFNVWTACTTLAQLLEKTQDPPRSDDAQVLFLDRGILDALCWLQMMEHLSRIRKADREKIETFLLADEWRRKITGVVLMSASPDDAMDRERGYLPVPGAVGSIMNPDVLAQMGRTIDAVADRLRTGFRIAQVNTSSARLRNKPQKTCQEIADHMLNWIEQELDEEILNLPRRFVEDCFGGKASLVGDQANKLLDAFRLQGSFRPREEVEASLELVQALPVVVVRNRSGDVLQLRRRERTSDSPLHEKIVTWAGGHVRRDDAASGDAIPHAAARELHEELCLDTELESLNLLGAVYIATRENLQKHAAIVYEWRAQTDDVAVSLSTAEFFERRGTSLSGKFVKIDDLVRHVQERRTVEEWTVTIIRELLADSAGKVDKELFEKP